MRSAPVPPRVSSGREAAYRGKRLGMQESGIGAGEIPAAFTYSLWECCALPSEMPAPMPQIEFGEAIRGMMQWGVAVKERAPSGLRLVGLKPEG